MNKIRFSGLQYNALKTHLFPGDGCEAVAIALCGRSRYGDNHTLTVQEVMHVPYEACFERKPDRVSWPTDVINPLLEKAAKKNLALVKIHCHPGYYEAFSDIDNYSDDRLFRSIHAWLQFDEPHASCIMLPDGRLFGRFFDSDMTIHHIQQITVAGSEIHQWHYSSEYAYNEKLQVRNLQAFGKRTIQLLSNMKIGVVGCSGTGSIVIEQLKRYGVGHLVLVDPDYVDFLNLNRILCSIRVDAERKTAKTIVMERAIKETGFNTLVTRFEKHVSAVDVVKELADCDILFSCVDGAEGRHILNLISSFYNLVLIDMGVKLEAEEGGGIKDIHGCVHIVQPGGSSLLSRGQYSVEMVRSEAIRRANSEEVKRNQYLAAVQESSPAVISINMQVAAAAVNEFLARLHPFRNVHNSDIDAVKIMFNDCVSYPESLPDPCPFFLKYVGKGDIEPLLNNPELSQNDEIFRKAV
ncbi:MAG: ThiF family adenylyltransferase [Bacteroidia bacterium]|nr:ThiF family adenylyltransferase [Bacteroidia bacterium]